MLRTLVDRVRAWTPDDTARAERLALLLESSAAGGAKGPPAVVPVANETGIRAFLARESAALGSAIDQAARSLGNGQAGTDLLTAVLRRMQPLRGLAALADYPPLHDLLDGIEETVSAVGRLELTPADAGERLGAAALALTRGARDIADRGRPDPDAPEFRRFATLLLAPVADVAPVVPIENLFFAGEDGVVQRGVAPRGPIAASLGTTAVVSRGEHLCQIADEIAEATSDAQRDLRLHVVITDLRTLGSGLPAGLDIAVEAFATSARGAVTRGAAAADPARFSSLIREAGGRLRGFTETTDAAMLGRSFDALIAGLDLLGASAAVAPISPAAPAREELIVPIESLAPVPTAPPIAADLDDDVVPIESLAPDEEAEPLTSVGSTPAVPADNGQWDLAASWSQFESLVQGDGLLVPTEVLVPAMVATVTVVETVEVVALVAAVVAIPATDPAAATELDAGTVDIEALCYRGQSARQRAGEVRRELRLALTAQTPPESVIPLVDELYDLVELALTP